MKRPKVEKKLARVKLGNIKYHKKVNDSMPCRLWWIVSYTHRTIQCGVRRHQPTSILAGLAMCVLNVRKKEAKKTSCVSFVKKIMNNFSFHLNPLPPSLYITLILAAIAEICV